MNADSQPFSIALTAATLVALLTLGGVAAAASTPGTTSVDGAQVHCHVVHGWPQLPLGRDLGAVSGVGVDAHDNVYVFHRNDRSWPKSNVLSTDPIPLPTVTVFDGHTGRIISEWGAHTFAMPHGLTVDAHGNVWLTDESTRVS